MVPTSTAAAVEQTSTAAAAVEQTFGGNNFGCNFCSSQDFTFLIYIINVSMGTKRPTLTVQISEERLAVLHVVCLEEGTSPGLQACTGWDTCPSLASPVTLLFYKKKSGTD